MSKLDYRDGFECGVFDYLNEHDPEFYRIESGEIVDARTGERRKVSDDMTKYAAGYVAGYETEEGTHV